MPQKLIKSKANFTLNTSIEMYILSVDEVRLVQFTNEEQAEAFFQLGQIEEVPSGIPDIEEEHHEEHHEEYHDKSYDELEDEEDPEPGTIQHLLSGRGLYHVRYVPEYGALLVTERHHHHHHYHE